MALLCARIEFKIVFSSRLRTYTLKIFLRAQPWWAHSRLHTRECLAHFLRILLTRFAIWLSYEIVCLQKPAYQYSAFDPSVLYRAIWHLKTTPAVALEHRYGGILCFAMLWRDACYDLSASQRAKRSLEKSRMWLASHWFSTAALDRDGPRAGLWGGGLNCFFM